MEIDRVPESLFVSEAPGSRFQGFDPAIYAFGMAVVDTKHDGVENAPQVLPQGLRRILHGLETTARHPVDQPLPAFVGPRAALVVPQSGRAFFDSPGPSGLQRRLAQRAETALLMPAHIAPVAQPVVLGALHALIAHLEQFAVFLAAYLIDGFAQILRNVESVKGNFVLCIFQRILRRLDIRRPHIHTDALNTVNLFFGQQAVEFLQALGFAVFRHMQHRSLLLIGHHRDVVMALAVGGLIHAELLRRQLASACQAALDRALHDCINRIPAQAQALRYSADRRFLQPVNHYRLKQRCEATARFRPRHCHRDNTVLAALHPGHLSHQQRFQLTGIQMPPAPLSLIVPRTFLPAFRACELAAVLDHHFDFVFRQRYLHTSDLPRLLDAQYLAV